MNLQKTLTKIAPTYDYLYELLDDVRNDKPFRWGGINLAGGRHSYKTSSYIILCWTLALLFPQKTFKFYFVRKKVENKVEAWREVQKWKPINYKGKLYENKTEKTIIGPNFKFWIWGLPENEKEGKIGQLGTSREQCDYSMVCFDEAWEFAPEDEQRVLIAIGGHKYLTVFRCANPYSPYSHYFQQFARNLPFDLYAMKTKGEKFLVNWDPIMKHPTIWHWTCYIRAAKDGLLAEDTVRLIEASDYLDPTYGSVVKYGKPLTLKGGIYEVEKIIELDPDPDNYTMFRNGSVVVGLDFGYTSDPTRAIIAVVSEQANALLVLEELSLDPRIERFQHKQYSEKIVKWIGRNLEMMRCHQENIRIYCDWEHWGQSELTTVYRQMYPHHSVYFTPAPKTFKKKNIAKRIKCVSRLLSTGGFMIVKGRAPHLIHELTMAVWDTDEDGTRLERRKPNGADHSLDALEYAIMDWLDELAPINLFLDR